MRRFSVIIPTYHRKAELICALDSVFAQNEDIEAIVCDDGSTDGTEGLFRETNPFIKYNKLPHTGGPSEPRNYGLSVATGEWICFLDSDDAWLPGKLKRQHSAMVDAGTLASCPMEAGLLARKECLFS